MYVEEGMDKKDNIRLGKISFINNSPIYYALEMGIVSAPCQIVEGIPRELNTLLFDDQLDMGPISSLEYGYHSKDYLILPNLSISSYGPVGSVILFSKVPIERLDGHPILVTSVSGTSQVLLRLVLEEEYGIFPKYIQGEIHENQYEREITAGLTIGDLALKVKNDKGRFPYYLDLGEIWTKRTGFPFVFAIWVVKKRLYVRYHKQIDIVHKVLLSSKAWGLDHLGVISRDICSRVNLRPPQCEEYLGGLSFDLGESHQKGLLLFFNRLSHMGIINSDVRLEFINNLI